MATALPSITGRSWSQFRGITDEVNSKGLSTDYRPFTVSKTGDYNFKINNSYTSFKIVDSRNKVVAEAKSAEDIAQVHGKLAPGNYTAIISQTKKGVNNREYTLDVTERQNPMILSSGGTLRGYARQATGGDTGVQKHGLNVIQGGDFTANFTFPQSRWAIMDKDGKVVASGDTKQTDTTANDDFLKKTAFKLEPGQYDVVVVLPRNVAGEIPWNLTLVPKTTDVSATKAEERPIDKILREREARLKQWAAEDAAKSSSSATKTYA